MATKTNKSESEEPEEEQYPLTYTINVYDGGTFNINIGEHCEVRIMSGQPTPPPNPPKG